VLDALRTGDVLRVRAADATGDAARLAVDGRDETVWQGRPGETQWRWVAEFARPVHLGLLRARFGASATSGVPTAFRWEVRSTDGHDTCAPLPPGPGGGEDGWAAVPGASEEQPGAASGTSAAGGAVLGTTVAAGSPESAASDTSAASLRGVIAQPTRRSWFLDADACALRLVVDRTNAGPPVLREVQALESARDVLRGATATDDGAYPGFRAADAVDGTYARRWAGAPDRSQWTLRVDLPEPQPVDRVRLVLGFDATSVPRPGGGRRYAMAWGPVRYVLEASEDGRQFTPIASEPVRPDGTVIPLRRRLVKLSGPQRVRALRLVMTGATGADGVPQRGAVPVVREIAAFRGDDPRTVLAAPWLLSVNANPSAESRLEPGGEMMNDAYHAKFLQRRFAGLVPGLRRDDRFARALGDHGEPLDAPPNDEAGEALESIEGDDAQLDARFLAESSPPPIAVLSGSNDWDYAADTGPDPGHPRRWRWDPLRDAREGGMARLAPAVQERVAPFLGFCGGAQLLALLEAKSAGAAAGSRADDQRAIDRLMERITGRAIRGFARQAEVERDWPADPHPHHATVQFAPDDPLFADIAGPGHRATTQALPELHADAVRAEAFLPGGPLARFALVASSSYCAPVSPAAPAPAAPPAGASRGDPARPGECVVVPEAFRSRGDGWPVIGTQFHPEQRDFLEPGPGDPPESVADARLFVAAAYEQMVDAYVKLAP
jgi:hypothetical protein